MDVVRDVPRSLKCEVDTFNYIGSAEVSIPDSFNKEALVAILSAQLLSKDGMSGHEAQFTNHLQTNLLPGGKYRVHMWLVKGDDVASRSCYDFIAKQGLVSAGPQGLVAAYCLAGAFLDGQDVIVSPELRRHLWQGGDRCQTQLPMLIRGAGGLIFQSEDYRDVDMAGKCIIGFEITEYPPGWKRE